MKNLLVMTLPLAVMLAGCSLVDTTEILADPIVPTASGGGGLTGVSYDLDVQPILDDLCVECHSGASPARGIDMSSYDTLLAADVIVPGNAQGSLLYSMPASGAMPPPGRLGPSDDDLAILAAWIDGGALNN